MYPHDNVVAAHVVGHLEAVGGDQRQLVLGRLVDLVVGGPTRHHTAADLEQHHDHRTPQETGTWRREGNVLFNDAINTVYLRLYCGRHMVKDHSDSERGNPLLPH